MGVRGRAIGYQAIETRVRIYQARVPADIVEGVEDELHTQGWMPLTRERRVDGSLRVIYERLPVDAVGELREVRRVPRWPVVRHDVARALATIVVVGAVIVVAAAGLALLATPA
jgi:hypothetical protein